MSIGSFFRELAAKIFGKRELEAVTMPALRATFGHNGHPFDPGNFGGKSRTFKMN